MSVEGPETRGWKTRVKTPGGQYSFEALSAALKKEAKEAAEKAKFGGVTSTSEWAKKAAAASGPQPRHSDGGGKDSGPVRSHSFVLALVRPIYSRPFPPRGVHELKCTVHAMSLFHSFIIE